MPEPDNNANALDLTPGQRVDQYEIVRLLGKGGMGAVYLAIDTTDDRQVAIKILFQQLSTRSGDYIRRFLREARVACKINHPNLVKVYDCSFNDRYGFYYIVQEYISGGTLKQLIHSDTVLREEEALTVAIGVSRALTAARKVGVVHRDIKPDNIMFAADGTIKLADWGIAKRLDTGNLTEHTQELTKVKSFIGTPLYAAPEQIEDASQVDPRADIYSLGASIYYALVGKPPLKGNTEMESLVMVVRTKAPDIRNARPDVSECAARMIARMLEKNPDDRYQTPESLLIDLLSALRKLGVNVPDTLPEIAEGDEMTTPEDGTRMANLDRLHEILDSPEPLPESTLTPSARNTSTPRQSTRLPTHPTGSETPRPPNPGKRLAILAAALVCIALVVAGAAKAFVDYAAKVRQRSEEEFVKRLEEAKQMSQNNPKEQRIATDNNKSSPPDEPSLRQTAPATDANARAETTRLATEKTAALELAKIEAEQQAKETADKLKQAETERLETEARAKREAEQLAKIEAEQQAKEAADKLKQEKLAENKAKEAADKFAQAEAERQTKEAADKLRQEKLAKIEAENKAKETADKFAQAEAERIAKEAADKLEMEQQAKREAERKVAEATAKREAERLAKEAADKLEMEQQAKREAERKVAEATAKREAERLAKEAADKLKLEQQAKIEAERKAQEVADKLAQAEAERKTAEATAKREAVRIAKEAADKLKLEQQAKIEAERKAKEAADKLKLEQQAKIEAERKAQEATDKLAQAETERKAAAETAKREAERIANKDKELTLIGEKLTPEALKQAINNADTTLFNGFPALQNAFTFYTKATESLQQARANLEADEYFRNNRDPILFIDSCREMWEIAATMQEPRLITKLQNETSERMLDYLTLASNNLLNSGRFAMTTDAQQAKTRRQFLQLLAACDELTAGKISLIPDDSPLRRNVMMFFSDMYYHPNIHQPEPDYPGSEPERITWLKKAMDKK